MLYLWAILELLQSSLLLNTCCGISFHMLEHTQANNLAAYLELNNYETSSFVM